MADIICCTCLYKSANSHEYVSLEKKIRIKDDVLKLSKMLFDCIRVDYDEYDGLGNLVCQKCTKKISCLYDFRRTCLKSQKTLLQELQTTKDAVDVDVSNFVKVECEVDDVKYESTEIIEIQTNDLDDAFDDSDADRQDEDDCLADYDIRYNDDSDGNESSDYFSSPKSDNVSSNKHPKPEIVGKIIEKTGETVKRERTKVNKSNSYDHDSNDLENSFICDYCKKTFTKKMYLKVSMIILFLKNVSN